MCPSLGETYCLPKKMAACTTCFVSFNLFMHSLFHACIHSHFNDPFVRHLFSSSQREHSGCLEIRCELKQNKKTILYKLIF